MAVNGTSVACLGGGLLLVYSGVTGKKFSATFRSLITGQAPGSSVNAFPVANTNYGTSVTGTTSVHDIVNDIPAPAGDKAAVAIAFARAQIGKPYVFGATGPNSYDCSGLIQAAYKAAGVGLPRTTYQQILIGKNISQSDLIPGDLIFPDAGHVQLYSGNGNIIEAPESGQNVKERKIWGFWRARRVV
jgi:cell wall-associated NlpC family hydrolase